MKRAVPAPIDEFMESLVPTERLIRTVLVDQVKSSPLYTKYASTVEESYRFGWLRGKTMELETQIRGRWHAWLTINSRSEYDETTDYIPDCEMIMNNNGQSLVNKMLDNCMNKTYHLGYRGSDFLEWLGYGLGISYFNKPNVSEEAWQHWYDTFDVALLLLYPSDYFSMFLNNYAGQSGNLAYYPTPPSISHMIQRMLTGNKITTESCWEPTMGAGALLLESKSLNLVGGEYNITMVKASCVQAFLYQPWLLYVPKAITNIHFHKEEQRIFRYFEFDTDTRIYHGDSLIGEYRVPTSIFEEDSTYIDIYVTPLDLSKNTAIQVEEKVQTANWSELSKSDKIEIVKAQSRNINFEVIVSNPPFGKMNSASMQAIERIEQSNKVFLEERNERLEKLHLQKQTQVEEIIDITTYLISNAKGQLVMDWSVLDDKGLSSVI